MKQKVPQIAIEFIRSIPPSQRVAYARAIEMDYMEGVSWGDAVAIAKKAWRAGVRLAVSNGSLRAL